MTAVAAETVIGRTVRRTDGEAKVRGTAVYCIDYEEPRMLHAKLLRSPVAAGRIVRLDTSRAEAMPGVRAVITAADAPGLGGWLVQDQTLLAADLVRYIGEPVAGVAAETLEQARAAVRAFELEIEPTVAVTDIESALAPDAPLIHPAWASYASVVEGRRQDNIAWEVTLQRGDVDEGFARADLVVEDEFVTPRQHQSYIEPRCAVSRYENGRYIIHTSTQFPYNVRDRVAQFLRVRKSDVRVIVPTVGGGFGGKLDSWIEPLCAILARKAGRPVKLVNTRREEFISATVRENVIIRMRSAVTRDGEILAREATCLIDSGAYCGETPAIASLPAMFLASTYRVGSTRVVGRAVYTNTAPTGAFRGVGAIWSNFALERHMDHIAAELGLDRRDFRLKHIYRDGDYTAIGQRLDDAAFLDAFERIEAIAPWAEVSKRRPHRGVGIAAVVTLTNPMAGSATLKLNDDGTIGLITAATECGSGAVAAGLVQIVAAELAVDPQDVVVVTPDTDVAAFDAGAQGSRTLFNVGNAIRLAAGEMREQIFETASDLMEVSAEDLELAEGHVRVVGSPHRRVSLESIAQATVLNAGPIQGTGRFAAAPIPYDTGCLSGAIFATLNAATYHVHLAEVEVDPETGKVIILRYVVAQDVGKVINPSAIEGQIHGGVLQGLGYVLYEDLRLENGRYIDQSFETYRVPTAFEAPPIDIILLEHPAPNGPFGAKGAAEPSIIPVAGAIANAVSEAVGKPFNRLPITPFDILASLRGQSPDPAM